MRWGGNCYYKRGGKVILISTVKFKKDCLPNRKHQFKTMFFPQENKAIDWASKTKQIYSLKTIFKSSNYYQFILMSQTVLSQFELQNLNHLIFLKVYNNEFSGLHFKYVLWLYWTLEANYIKVTIEMHQKWIKINLIWKKFMVVWVLI